mgnify:CR=1 FL=1
MANFRSSPNNTQGTKRHRGTMNVSGSVRGHELFLIHGACNFNTAAEKFLPMGYNDVEAAGGGYLNRFVAPARGRWVKSYVRSSVAADTSILKLYRAIDGTSNPNLLLETMAWRFDPETQPDLTNFTHVLELYTRKDIP